MVVDVLCISDYKNKRKKMKHRPKINFDMLGIVVMAQNWFTKKILMLSALCGVTTK